MSQLTVFAKIFNFQQKGSLTTLFLTFQNLAMSPYPRKTLQLFSLFVSWVVFCWSLTCPKETIAWSRNFRQVRAITLQAVWGTSTI